MSGREDGGLVFILKIVVFLFVVAVAARLLFGVFAFVVDLVEDVLRRGD